ncbi:MAG: protein arginine kinase [Caloramator sp.]|nr:protein arginine kinase [Caloramator sp.]
MSFFSKSNDSGIVLTSRIRFARNIDGMPFPQVLSDSASKKVIDDVYSALLNSSFSEAKNLKLINLKDMDRLNMMAMVERHVISRDIIENFQRAAIILDNDEKISIMLNEEDHIRLQVMYKGLMLKEAFEDANKIDDAIEENITYAFDAKFGYLTSCPTNVGTGMRASVMLHLPALTFTKNINNILNTVSQVGMTIRGLYGEGSNALGNIYQVSNQVALGFSEEEIINSLIAVINKIVDQEEKAREIMAQKRSIALEDDVYRSLGLLKFARSLDTNECLPLISQVRLGDEMGIIKEVDIKKLNELITLIQPATLQLLDKRELEPKDRDVVRARMVREYLK